MKFQNFISFEQHFFKAEIDQLPKVFALFLESNYELQLLIKKCLKHIAEKIEDIEIVATEDLEQEIGSQSLFAKRRLFLIKDLELLTKDQLAEKLSLITESAGDDLFILSGAKMPAYFYSKVKKYAIVLDLASEKPWEKQKRLEQMLYAFAKERGFNLGTDALGYLMQYAPLDLGIMQQELLKVFNYIDGSKKEISITDLQEVGVCYEEANSWKLAENLLWGIGEVDWDLIDPATFLFYPFLGTLRYHCYLGLFLAQREIPIEETPYQRLRMLDKYRDRKYPTHFFTAALQSIYKVEKLARTRAVSSRELLELLIIELAKEEIAV